MKFDIVYADPPWSYGDRGCSGAAEHHYRTMKLDDIKNLHVGEICSTDAVLFMWATYPLLPEALATISAWGFTYKSIAFQWVKSKGEKAFFGLGRWTRGNTECCLLATKGKPHRVSASVGQLIFAEDFDGETLTSPVTRHSAKPPEVRERITKLMGDLPRIELFARERGSGWHAWGDALGPAIVTPLPWENAACPPP